MLRVQCAVQQVFGGELEVRGTERERERERERKSDREREREKKELNACLSICGFCSGLGFMVWGLRL